MLERVWRSARRSTRIDRLIVATDDRRILDAAAGFGAEAMLTSPSHPSGTDRVAEVAGIAGETFRVVLNIQGDEPLLTPASLDRLITAFDADPAPEMATLAEPLQSANDLFDPNVVKLVTRLDGRALYFSRAPIPFHRGSAARLRPDFRGGPAARCSSLAPGTSQSAGGRGGGWIGAQGPVVGERSGPASDAMSARHPTGRLTRHAPTYRSL